MGQRGSAVAVVPHSLSADEGRGNFLEGGTMGEVCVAENDYPLLGKKKLETKNRRGRKKKEGATKRWSEFSIRTTKICGHNQG